MRSPSPADARGASRACARAKNVHCGEEMIWSFYVTVIDPESGEVVRQTNAFDAFIVDA